MRSTERVHPLIDRFGFYSGDNPAATCGIFEHTHDGVMAFSHLLRQLFGRPVQFGRFYLRRCGMGPGDNVYGFKLAAVS